MERIEKCPVCDHQEFSLHLETKDHSVTKEVFRLDKCNHCGFIFTNPRPGENSIGKYYAFEEYISHTDSNKGIINKIYRTVRNITLKEKLKLINRLSTGKKGKLLDVGCGTGYFLSTCKKDGWAIMGTEPDTQARNLAQENTGQEIKENVFETHDHYDIITLWHVLEHIHQLNRSLEHISRQLNNDGTLIIAVPNHRSYDAQKYREYWAAYDVPRHLYHFDIGSMKKLLDKHGMKIVDIRPMKFDSFYVSMMSEKHKGKGSLSIISAFFSGLVSNMKASQDMNYSSLIYIFKKK